MESSLLFVFNQPNFLNEQFKLEDKINFVKIMLTYVSKKKKKINNKKKRKRGK